MSCRVRGVTPWWQLHATDARTIGNKRRGVSVLRWSRWVEWIHRCTIGLQARMLTSKSQIVFTKARMLPVKPVMLSAKVGMTTKGRLLTIKSRVMTTKVRILSVWRPK